MQKSLLAFMAVAIVACSAAGAMFLIGAAMKPFTEGVYGDPPRAANGSVDLERTFAKVSSAGAGTYNFLMTDTERDVSELERLLPEAQRRGVKIWVTVLPPAALAPERRTDMRYVDYIGIARSIAELSARHENLEAWSIDNVIVDADFFSPSYLERITSEANRINPDLMFIPVAYYGNVASPGFSERARHFDGIQFYYTHFPEGESDESATLLPQLAQLRQKFPGKVILGIYASPWSKDYPTSASYVGQLLNLARQHTDGAMVYTMDQEGEKLSVIKGHFGG